MPTVSAILGDTLVRAKFTLVRTHAPSVTLSWASSADCPKVALAVQKFVMDRRTAQMEVMKTRRCAPVLVRILISADLSPTDVSVPFESVMASQIVKEEKMRPTVPDVLTTQMASFVSRHLPVLPLISVATALSIVQITAMKITAVAKSVKITLATRLFSAKTATDVSIKATYVILSRLTIALVLHQRMKLSAPNPLN